MGIKIQKILPLFEPDSRYAILINNYDLTYKFLSGYTEREATCRGNRRIFELEATLSGEIANSQWGLGKRYQDYWNLWWKDEIASHHANRIHLPYLSVTRIMPSHKMRSLLYSTIDSIAEKAKTDSLTLVFLTTHGSRGSFVLNDTHTSAYSTLLNHLDKVGGKKVICAFACYSGSLISINQTRKKKGDYLVLTSTNPDEKGINWDEDILFQLLLDNLKNGKKLSELTWPIRTNEMGQNHQIAGSFDVVL